MIVEPQQTTTDVVIVGKRCAGARKRKQTSRRTNDYSHKRI